MIPLPNPFQFHAGGSDACGAVAGPCLDPTVPATGISERNVDDLIDWDALYDATLPPEPPLFLREPLKAYELVSMLGVLAGH